MSPGTLDIIAAIAATILTPLGFIAIWCTVSFAMSFFSGWRRLAAVYGTELAAPGGQQSTPGGVGPVGYRGSLLIASSGDGLDLRVDVPFRMGHRALRIPWEDITDAGSERSFSMPIVRLRLGPDGPCMRIPRTTWERFAPQKPAQDESGT